MMNRKYNWQTMLSHLVTLTLTGPNFHCHSKYKFIFWTLYISNKSAAHTREHNKNDVKIITRNHADHSKQHFLVLGILYTVCALTTVWIYVTPSVTFTNHCMHKDIQVCMHTQEMNRDSCVVNLLRTHTTHTSNIAFIYIMYYVGHHRGGLFFLLHLICIPYSFYTYK